MNFINKQKLLNPINFLLFFSVILLAMSFFFDFYKIPSDSMQNTISKGDVLITLKYKKYLQTIEKDDILVFHFPMEDSVFSKRKELNYYDAQKLYNIDSLLSRYPKKYGKVIFKNISERTELVKRCVGVSGDTLQIKNNDIYINNALWNSKGDINFEKKKRQKKGRKKEKILWIFPNNASYDWTLRHFGPMLIPEKDLTVSLNPKTIHLYKKVIETYENNTLNIVGDKIYINGSLVETYTFKKNYYFVLGDRRFYSKDSRFWGVLPEDHITSIGLSVF